MEKSNLSINWSQTIRSNRSKKFNSVTNVQFLFFASNFCFPDSRLFLAKKTKPGFLSRRRSMFLSRCWHSKRSFKEWCGIGVGVGGWTDSNTDTDSSFNILTLLLRKMDRVRFKELGRRTGGRSSLMELTTPPHPTCTSLKWKTKINIDAWVRLQHGGRPHASWYWGGGFKSCWVLGFLFPFFNQ